MAVLWTGLLCCVAACNISIEERQGVFGACPLCRTVQPITVADKVLMLRDQIERTDDADAYFTCGDLLQQDGDVDAITQYTLAAERDSASALQCLGYIYHPDHHVHGFGEGVIKSDARKAAECWHRAAKLG